MTPMPVGSLAMKDPPHETNGRNYRLPKLTIDNPSEPAPERGSTQLPGICGSNGDNVYLDYLANHKALVPEVAGLLYGHWSDLFQAGHISKQALTALLTERAVTHQLPLTLVALDKGALAGTGSIELGESGTKLRVPAELTTDSDLG